MDRQRIISELKAERNRLDKAIVALSGLSVTGKSGNGRRKRGRHHMSAAGRKRISDAMKRRWAAKKR